MTGQNQIDQAGPTSVVVLDDDQQDRALVVTSLVQAGVKCVEVESPQKLFRLLETQPWTWRPRAFFVDLVLPGGISGYDVIRRLVDKYGSSSGIPIVVISKLSTKDDITEAQFAGADAFLPKPLKAENVALALSSVEENLKKSPDDRIHSIIVIK